MNGDGVPQLEDPDNLLPGGDDIIDFLDGSADLYGYGGAGNDKVVGGLHTNSSVLHGGFGDDKVWGINPE